MGDFRTRWLAFYADHVESVSREVFAHIEKMIVGTLIVSAGAHVSSSEPAIVLFGYLRHSFIGLGVELVGVALLLLNFIDGLYKLAKLNWHVAFQILMALFYITLTVRLIQLILAFRGEKVDWQMQRAADRTASAIAKRPASSHESVVGSRGRDNDSTISPSDGRAAGDGCRWWRGPSAV